MMFPLHSTLLVATATLLEPSHAFSLSSQPSLIHRAGSSSSTFTRRQRQTSSRVVTTRRNYSRGDMQMYEPGHDPPNEKNKPGSTEDGGGVWTALANTERWISETLESSNRAAAPGQPAGVNPYSRKEVSYVCETADTLPAFTAGAFRRLKDAREFGETHAAEQEHILAEKGPAYQPKTTRQTHVVVVPSCEELNASFKTFDSLVNAINQARRSARDFVTDVALEKLDERIVGEGERDWIVSINCAHLHPNFGEKTAEEILAEMEKEEEDGEVDLNVQEYKEKRLQARQSPYPTLVVEVMATPPPDFGKPAAPQSVAENTASGSSDKVSSADVQKLEALFGQSAALDHPVDENDKVEDDVDEDEEAFWAAFGKAGGIEEISAVTPTAIAHKWVAANEPSYDESKSTFVVSDTKHVDAGYEFVFSNIAMQWEKTKSMSGVKELVLGKRSYLVMSNFLTSSATSFEKFAMEVNSIISTIPGLSDELALSTLHPEHVEKEWRSPIPILVLQWYNTKTD